MHSYLSKSAMSAAMWGLSWAHGSGGLTSSSVGRRAEAGGLDNGLRNGFDGLLEALILACSTYHRRPI
jgi:hypothetical protein